jgi:predicted transcriptional regulator
MTYVGTPPKGETVTFRLDPNLKAELTKLAEQDQKSLGELLRELAAERVQRVHRRAFAAEARRQSLLIAARAEDPNSDEAEVMRWIEAVADSEAWKP